MSARGYAFHSVFPKFSDFLSRIGEQLVLKRKEMEREEGRDTTVVCNNYLVFVNSFLVRLYFTYCQIMPKSPFQFLFAKNIETQIFAFG